MAGIYLHIPFCKQACHYCNFHFSTNHSSLPDMVTAIQQEIQLQQQYLGSQPVETIYFGGGTPSLLSTAAIAGILDTLRSHFNVQPGVEITLETNPDDFTEDKPAQWAAAGVNRLSIGIQSFYDADLQWMNRAHNAQQAKQCIAWARAAGIHNITIDLIYGTPTLSDEGWKNNVQKALALGVPHLSCYALTVEPQTALHKMIEQHKKEAVDTDKQGRHFELLMDWLGEAGYEHYEISNFAKPGFRSRHNSSYWQGSHYLGLGPSAHSFNGTSRQWNIANNALYLKAIASNEVPFELETLTATQQLNEYIMTSLRTMEGLSLDKVALEWGAPALLAVEQLAVKYIHNGLMVQHDRNLRLTPQGKLLADGIAADFFQ
ncbi:radical SAM family heme chaperone HemW [Deminuibacter soli]|uniref:Heme chaperone HemW n=1 Tax=Deminuibacter soli TaxID=2291815 RepID=A0A3E1NF54_9BACT|nr:radical SAM family heme chaperone HemW [Deminuibacter soli]RFM26600.1 coproporphyrinogen III oxidase family protein [Deminuibacter soli]